ncbi:carboxypeptidase-like regulatory domain-containing protein, partial [Geomonas azotofigens]|uniref:carboxypeptidase-like regulatory domain-containing protein n=1 Tax=Geomonas azotofigens TaxID=2843196 RepID=UPI001C0FAB09
MKLALNRIGLVLLMLIILFGTINTALAWTLSGTIYGGSNPLPNAIVEVHNAVTAVQVATTTTDANGAYSVAVSDGSYNLLISPPSGRGLTDSTVNGIIINGVDVTQNIILIQQAVTLSGAIRNLTGTGVANVKVTVSDQASGVSAGQVSSDGNGNYSVPLASGTYKLSVEGGSSSAWISPTTNVPAPHYFHGYDILQNVVVSTNTTQNITMPFVTLSGKTTDNNEVPVSNVKIIQEWGHYVSQSVGYYLTWNGQFEPVTSDALGNYSITVVSTSADTLTLIPPPGSGLAQTVANGINATTDAVKNFPLQQAVTLSGKIQNLSGIGVANVKVTVSDQASGVSAGQVSSDASGNYSVPLASGTYKLSVEGGSSSAWISPTTNVPAPHYFHGYDILQNVVVSANTTQNITMPFVTLSGKTTDNNGVPVSNVKIIQEWGHYVSQSVGYYLTWNGQFEPVTSDALGNYSITVVSTSADTLTLIPPPGSGLAQTVANGINATTDAVKNFPLQQAVTLSGKIQNLSGIGVANVKVTVSDQASGVSAGQVSSDASGNYSVPLASGTYKLSVEGGSSSAWISPTTNVPAPHYFHGYDILQNVVVSANTTQNITMPFVTLSGKTTDNNGVPVSNVKIIQEWGHYVSQSV